MESSKAICLLNDSFPPLIDGVANAVANYARVIQSSSYEPIVITPDHPDADDSTFPYPVIRYPSIDTRRKTGYLAGVPFSPETARKLSGKDVAILHTHCPIMSAILGRELRQIVDAPLVLTYHTKFDIDIANILKGKLLRDSSKKALLENINACDEIWAVSQGAADNLHTLGYEGECIVMPNGVDLPRSRVSTAAIASATEGYDLPADVPVFLFVGRMMWYKGLKIIADALTKLKAAGDPFRMVFIGSGADEEEVKAYISHCGIADRCIFTGPVRDREILRAWYCRADLFLFPSTFDTNGLVVREAAACSLGSVLVRGSCAAEGVTDGRNGVLIEETAESLFACLRVLTVHPEQMVKIGESASRELYISWDESVKHALDRYEIVIERYRSGGCPAHHKPVEELLKLNGDLMEDLGHLQDIRQTLRHNFRENIRSAVPAHIRNDFRSHIQDAFKNKPN